MKSTDNSWIAAQCNHPREWYAERSAYMKGFLTEERVATLERVLAQRTHYLTVCMENTYHPQNASALVRSCEAFGLQRIHAIEDACRFQPNVNIVRGTDKWVDIFRHRSTSDAVSLLKSEGYRIVATTPHRGDSSPMDFDVSAGPFALVFGTEHAGISDEVILCADEFIRIPMCGFVESLNVSASAAILLYNLASRVRAEVDDWHLSEMETEELRFRWLMYAVRDSVNILKKKFGDE